MRVIVYFRQNGGNASAIPSSTHWTEGENEVPVPLFSVFDSVEKDDLPREILAQIDAANHWLKEHGGIVVETFTEIEDGSGRRPAYGTARKAAGQIRQCYWLRQAKRSPGKCFVHRLRAGSQSSS